MVNDKCENCKWSRGYHTDNREDALILICNHPNVKYVEEYGDISIFCTSQRTQGPIISFLCCTCGTHARYFKQRGGDGKQS